MEIIYDPDREGVLMSSKSRNIIIVGGGTSGSVLAARLSENSDVFVTLLEAGPDDVTYDSAVLEPSRAPDAWLGGPTSR